MPVSPLSRARSRRTPSVRKTLPKALDIADMHKDLRKGRFIPSRRGEIVFRTLYLAWFSIWGPTEILTTDRGTENENSALINAVHSMGVHWRPIPTEAPWSMGRNERQHGHISGAFLRIMSDTRAPAPYLALAVSYKARTAAPRSHGVAATTAVTGDMPCLLNRDNLHVDPAISSRHTAMQTARATMERYIAADRLRGTPSKICTNVPFVSIGQDFWFHRHRLCWLRGSVHSSDGYPGHVRHDGKLLSSHEARTKPFVARLLPAPLPRAHASPRPAPDPASSPHPVRTHAPDPPVPQKVAMSAGAYFSSATDTDWPNHPRWEGSSQTELDYFN